jgi:hypothetical protein
MAKGFLASMGLVMRIRHCRQLAPPADAIS